LAGSLRAEDFARLAAIRPDLVGVRGAACAGDRVGRIDPERVRALIRARDTWARAPSAERLATQEAG
jgi:(5-formylfuran-3-yl)methyl phosphate synthase